MPCSIGCVSLRSERALPVLVQFHVHFSSVARAVGLEFEIEGMSRMGHRLSSSDPLTSSLASILTYIPSFYQTYFLRVYLSLSLLITFQLTPIPINLTF